MNWYVKSQTQPAASPSEKIDLSALKFEMPHYCRKRCKVVWVDVQKFDVLWRKDTGFYVGPGGAGGIQNRYRLFGEFLKRGIPIEMPIAVVNEEGKVSFTNGRHRFAYLRDLGLKTIPISMDKEYVRYAEKYGVIA